MDTKRPAPNSLKRQILAAIEANPGRETTRTLANKLYGYYDQSTRQAILSHIHLLRKAGFKVVSTGRAAGGKRNVAGFWILESDISQEPKPLNNATFKELAEGIAVSHANMVELYDLATKRMDLRTAEYRRLTRVAYQTQEVYKDFIQMARDRGWDESKINAIFGTLPVIEYRGI